MTFRKIVFRLLVLILIIIRVYDYIVKFLTKIPIFDSEGDVCSNIRDRESGGEAEQRNGDELLKIHLKSLIKMNQLKIWIDFGRFKLPVSKIESLDSEKISLKKKIRRTFFIGKFRFILEANESQSSNFVKILSVNEEENE